MTRRIVTFDDNKCYGCGACVENCPFGSITMTAGKPRLTRTLCDGGGDCMYRCPAGAILFAVEEAEPFDPAAAAEAEARLGRPYDPDRECGYQTED